MKKDKTSEEFWRNLLVKNCPVCGGRGIISDELSAESIELCKCSRMVKQFVKMNDPVHGLHPKYHKWKMDNVFLSRETLKSLKKYLNHIRGELPKIGDKNPFRNLIIKGGQNAGKSSVAAIVYKDLMMREYKISIFRFSEIVTLSRMFMSNTQGFNDRIDLYDLLKYEDFIIIEDVDCRGHSGNANFERLGYALLDDIFSYRANHPKKATIITTDSSNIITSETMGSAFYYSICKSNVEDNEVFVIDVKN